MSSRGSQKTIRGLIRAIDPVRLAVLRGLATAGKSTVSDLERLCHASPPTIRRHLAELIVIGLVEKEDGLGDGETRGRPPTRYQLVSTLDLTRLLPLLDITDF